MDLRSGLPYWRAIHSTREELPPFEGEAEFEVVIVGGGVTGILISYFLTREGVSTVLVDQRQPGCGSTAASTGLLQYEIDTPLVDLIGKIGEARAVHAYRRGLSAIVEMEQLVDDLNDRSGFSRRSTLYFASSPRDAAGLRTEFDCRKQHGFDVELLEQGQISERWSIPAPLAIHSTGDGQIDPFRLSQRALQAAKSAGLRAFGNTRVTDVDERPDRIVLETDGGRLIGRAAVFATGYAAHEHLHRAAGTLHSTYAVVSDRLLNFTTWHEQCLIWETARPYFYARQTEDGRAMIGGEDTPFLDDHRQSELLDRQCRRLQARFEQLFPQIPFRPAFSWAGTFGETPDGLARIGTPPGRERAYFALGYGGNGITFSLIAARLITDLIVGRPNPDADVFGFRG